MSFDIRPINQQPMILGTQQMKNDGGGGNLGYMQQGKKKEKEEKEQEEQLLAKDSTDSIELNFDDGIDDIEENNDSFSAKKWIENISSKISDKFSKKTKNSNPFANM